ncbi:MAG: TraB/GumN family protein [Steroidobacteraceae bacterium]
MYRQGAPQLASLALVVIGMAHGAAIRAQLPAEPDELEAAAVIGERPGPALWRVSHEGRTLWILPTLAPLPQKVTWRSKEVEEVIAQAQEVYTEGSLDLRIGGNGADNERILQALANPGHKWLREVMPADIYAQFNALNMRYAGGDARLEIFRPFYAALELRKRALTQLQLNSDGQVHATIGFLARKHYVKQLGMGMVLAPRPAQLIGKLQRVPASVDNECARWQLLQLERELRDAMARANAWSAGDMQALRQDWEASRRQRQQASCTQLLQAIAPTERAIRETRRRNLRALEKALQKNRTTFALMMLEDMFDPDGLLAGLRAAGYLVEEPRS